MKEKDKREIKTNHYEEVLKTIMELWWKIEQRCLLEGCCYGYFEDEIKDHCIYCGKERKQPLFMEPLFAESLRNMADLSERKIPIRKGKAPVCDLVNKLNKQPREDGDVLGLDEVL